MRILLSNVLMDRPGGTQSWVSSMYEELSKNHEVHLHASTPNTYAPYIPIFDSRLSYDIGILNHNAPYRDLRKAQIRARIVTVHGVLPAQEKPAPWADQYVSVSEEIAAALPFKSVIVRNPINADRYSCDRPVREKLSKILVSSNYQGEAVGTILQAAALVGAQVEIIGKGNSVRDPLPYLCDADIVFGLGRTALEAMACGRQVFVFDYLGGEGFVTPDNVFDLRRRNFSGRERRYWYTAEELAGALSQYNPSVSMRPYVVAHHSPRVIVNEYLDLAEEIFTKPWMRARHSAYSMVLRANRKLSSPRVSQLISTRRPDRLHDDVRRRATPLHGS